jgi:twitching motility protein PilT
VAKVDQLLDALLERRGTDLHLRVGVPPLARVRGELVTVREDPVSAQEMEPLLMEIVTLDQRSRALEEHDLDFAYPYGGKAWFRASYLRTVEGLGAVFRRVPMKIPSLSELRLPESLRTLALKRSGLVLLTGGARSGKSVTLAAMLQHLNRARPCHVVTIEDPIELVHEPERAQITQREVGTHVPSIAEGIRGAMRDDANVVAVSDFPTHETLRLALELANAGVLVLGTMTTRSAAGTLERIVDETPPEDRAHVRGLLARCLTGIASQQLVELADGKARIAAVEILMGSDAVSTAIREGKPLDLSALILESTVPGTQTMDMALEKLVGERLITPQTALDKASDRDAFLKMGGKPKS